jgi:hypothetical protein
MLRKGLALLVVMGFVWSGQRVAAQGSVSPTPVPVQLPNAAAPDGSEQGAVPPTPTRTPTPVGPALLEAITEANVRAEADLESEKLGTIRAGDTYPILGRYFRWLQFQYDQSPNGTAWVFDELVTIIGDETALLDLNVNALPTVDVEAVNATGTWEVITQLPGGILTATAEARVLPAPGADSGGTGHEESSAALPQLMPTFTWPPDLAGVSGQTPTPITVDGTTSAPLESSNAPSDASLPPIAPILVLGGLGVMGLFVASIRR